MVCVHDQLHCVTKLTFVVVNVNCDISELVSPVSGQVFIVGTNAIYLCDTGYRLVGSRMRACESDRTWASSAPTCQSMLPFIITKLVIIPSLALLQNSCSCGLWLPHGSIQWTCRHIIQNHLWEYSYLHL